MASQDTLTRVQELYVAYYGRPADKGGLQYWADRVEADGGIDAIINAFGDSAEYTELAEGQGAGTLVNNIYQQAFGRDADDGGLAYYIGVLESGEKSLAEIATTIINAAGPGDKEVFEARAAAAAEYTESLDSDDDYDLAAAKEAVATAEPEADPSGLTEALSTLASAQTAEADFLNGQVDNELLEGLGLDETSSLQDIRDAIDTAEQNAASALSTHRTNEGSDNVIQALLQDAQEAFDAAEADVNAKAGLMAKIEARDATQEAYEAAVEAQADAEAEYAGAETTFEGKNEAADGDLSSNATVQLQVVDDPDAVTVTYKALTTESVTEVARVVDSGNGDTVLFTVTDGKVELAEGDLSDYAGLEALQASLQSQIEATASTEDALQARNEAAAEVDSTTLGTLDANFDANADHAGAFTSAQSDLSDFEDLKDTYNSALSTYKDDNTVSASQDALVSAYQALSAAYTTSEEASVTIGGSDSAADAAAVAAADAGIQTDISEEVTSLESDLDAAADALFVRTDKPSDLTADLTAEIAAEGDAREEAAAQADLVDAYDQEQSDLEAAQKVVDDRADLIAEANATESLNEEADALADAIVEADAALTDSEEDGGLGVTLLEGDDNFTSEDDVYLFAEAEGNQVLTGFGANGEDKIYFGEGFNLVEIAEGSDISDNVGDVAAQEILWQQDGNDLMLYVESETFGGNSAGTNDVVTIELTGVSAEDVNFEGGFLSAGEVA